MVSDAWAAESAELRPRRARRVRVENRAALLKLERPQTDPVRAMFENRTQSGPLIAAIGAALLGVSVFLPWYAVTLTANGAATAQQALNSIAQQFGNANFQAKASTVGAGFNAFAGHQVATLSAHQLLKYISVALLILAAIALVASLLHLAGSSQSIQAGGGQIALVGIAAALCVLFRMVARPAPAEGVFSLSLSWGIYLALASSVAIIVGGLWSTRAVRRGDSPGAQGNAWEQLSGWTPPS